MAKQGTLSINSENIFPIIKKWLYSDHDIFTRELISNGCDAILKFKKLCDLGETTDTLGEPFKVSVILNKTDKTLKFIDNGIGMTEEEIEKYITQIAFSGAEEFLSKYKDKMSDDQIIGHFGLGFYSAFMVADVVEIDTLSYKEGAAPVKWVCDGGTTYDLSEGTRATRGTTITLHVNDESDVFLNFYELRNTIEKYCSFMPVPIYVIDEEEEAKKAEEKANKAKEAAEKGEEVQEEVNDAPVAINNPTPLYTKKPNECTDEEYKEFYRNTFHDFNEPLFWIHLNMDYPFRLKGILYFPKLTNEFEAVEGTIKLYNSQVFVAENIKEVIPEFLLLLKGVIDCPDLPLNVSRSLLQNDGYVNKISDYIIKKVADKLISLCKNDKDNYVKFWDDIAPFIKYGCLKETKFNEKIKDYILFKTTNDEYLTLSEYLEKVKDTNENKVFYITDKEAQSQYINMFKDNGVLAVYLEHNIDAPFISLLERDNSNVKFMRIDSDISTATGAEAADKSNEEALTSLFKVSLNNDKVKVSVENLKSDDIASMLVVSEESRRMQEMMKMYNMQGMGLAVPDEDATLILNQNHDLVKALVDDSTSAENKELICNQLYDLAEIANRPLSSERMKAFLQRSNKILKMAL